MLIELKNGDIFIDVDNLSSLNAETEKEAFKNLKRSADHGLIYREGRIYHATRGSHQAGVRSHVLTHGIEISEEESVPLGSRVVLRPKDEKLSQHLAVVVDRWDPKLSREEAEKLPKDETHHVALLPTRFTDFFERKSDPENLRGILELYRAFRDYWRNISDPPIPLSKKKGVSCGNFVSISLKVAMIQRLFPSGIPTALKEKFEEIEKLKTPNDKRTDNTNLTDEEREALHEVTKLSQIDIQLFKEFEALVKENLKESKEIPEKFEKYIEFLYIPVKGRSVNDLCQMLYLNFNDLFDFKGFLFFKNKLDPREAAIMSLDTAKELCQQRRMDVADDESKEGREVNAEESDSDSEFEGDEITKSPQFSIVVSYDEIAQLKSVASIKRLRS